MQVVASCDLQVALSIGSLSRYYGSSSSKSLHAASYSAPNLVHIYPDYR